MKNQTKHPYFHDSDDKLFLDTRNVTIFNHLNTDELPLYITGKDAYSKDAYSIYFYPTPYYTKYSTVSSCRPVSCNQSCNSKPICYNDKDLKRSIYFPQYIKSVKHRIHSSQNTEVVHIKVLKIIKTHLIIKQGFKIQILMCNNY